MKEQKSGSEACAFSAAQQIKIGQTPDLPATHAAVATVAPFPAWRGSQGERCAEPEV